MRNPTRWLAALIFALAGGAGLAACGDDDVDTDPATQSDDEMTDDEEDMSDGEMTDDEEDMSDDEMTDDEMTDEG